MEDSSIAVGSDALLVAIVAIPLTAARITALPRERPAAERRLLGVQSKCDTRGRREAARASRPKQAFRREYAIPLGCENWLSLKQGVIRRSKRSSCPFAEVVRGKLAEVSRSLIVEQQSCSHCQESLCVATNLSFESFARPSRTKGNARPSVF